MTRQLRYSTCKIASCAFGGLDRRSFLGAVTLLAAGLCPVVVRGNDRLTFPTAVTLKPLGIAGMSGTQGTLIFKITPKYIELQLANLSAAGTTERQELRTKVRRSDFSLESSTVMDVVEGKPVRSMERRQEPSLLNTSPNAKPVDVFSFKEFKDARPTVTEPTVEHKVVDFISVILVAADLVSREDTQPLMLSILRDRSLTNVVTAIEGEETVSGKPGTRVRVSPPDNPNAGLRYVISKTPDGRYYPSMIRATVNGGTVEIEGIPEAK